MFSVLLAACGDMDTVIAKDASYNLEAFVGARNLDEGAAIRASDSIRPSFISEVEYDPDVTGIMISLETVGGTAAASDVIYRLSGEVSTRDVEKGVVRVPRLSGTLPSFDLPADLEVGRYILVMQVLGVDGVLFERRRSIFYLADAALSMDRIVSYPPGTGTSSVAPVFPTGIKLMLQAEIEADERLDPYVAWYVGTKRISMGRLTDGANRILWTTPSREGFQTIRVEVYPERPTDPKVPDLVGASADITIATANTAPLPGLPGENSDYVRLYRFLGDLTDSADAGDLERTFVRTSGAKEVWEPIDDSYGLSIGVNDQYRMELPLVPVHEGIIEAARITTRVAVFGPGSIWRASFASLVDGEGLQVELSAGVGNLELALIGDMVERRASISLPSRTSSDEAVLVDVVLSTGIETATATFSINDGQPDVVSVPLSSMLLESGSVHLGGSTTGTSSVVSSEKETAEATTTTDSHGFAVIDDFAVLFEAAQVAESDDSTFEI